MMLGIHNQYSSAISNSNSFTKSHYGSAPDVTIFAAKPCTFASRPRRWLESESAHSFVRKWT